jgi:glycosyltransferase involved in cell wall biosynthesis
MPDVTFALTGDFRRARSALERAQVPANVVLTGWVDTRTYKQLLADCDLVLGLTLLEGVQLSVANEAAGFGKAMVLSDTALLRELFPRGAVYVSNDPDSVQMGIGSALAARRTLEGESRRLREERLARWSLQAKEVEQRLAEPDVA